MHFLSTHPTKLCFKIQNATYVLFKHDGVFQIKAASIKRFVVLNIVVTKIEKFEDKFQCCWKQKYCYIKFKFSNLRSRLLTCYLCQGLCATFFYFNLDFDVASWQIKWLGLHWMDTGRPRFTWTKSFLVA